MQKVENKREQNKDKMNFPPYSVLMAVYANDDVSWFEEAVASMAEQTWKPQEMIIMQDGPVGEAMLRAEEKCAKLYPGLIRVVTLPQNVGLGEAMRLGVYECQNEWIARMDADDIADPRRCEIELEMAQKMQADIVGCDCVEFYGDITTPTARRVFPESHEELVFFSRRKCPFCHPAVMMKKSVVLKAGNYRKVFPHDDYDLFVRILASGAKGYTVKQLLYYIRVSPEFYKRRGGVKYMQSLLGFNVEMLKSGWMTPVDFFVRSCGNILFSVVPKQLRGWMYRRFLRK